MRKLLLLIVILVGATAVSAQDTAVPSVPLGNQYQWQEVASGFSRPLFLTDPNDGTNRLFVVSQEGQIWIVADGATLPAPFLDISKLVSRDANERGLLGLAFHPNYAENGLFFVDYTDVRGNTVVARYSVSSSDPNLADPQSALFLLGADQPYPNHNGGHIAFGPDGYLYIGLGDGGSQGDPQRNAQNGNSLLGKILRIDVDNGTPYGIPADNPYASVGVFLPEIWAMGLRNPWRFSFDQLTGDLYIADVGQNIYEEVNFQPAGAGGINYGWNIMEGKHRYSGEPVPDGLRAPIFDYTHNEGGCSVTGGYVYRGESLPALQGIYFFGDYCSGIIWDSFRKPDGTWQTTPFDDTQYSISSFGQDHTGELYLVNQGGSILKLVAAG
ncbi:MAG: PQQ-dependent sugar dehydrogenase [Anaerolineae bacterium]